MKDNRSTGDKIFTGIIILIVITLLLLLLLYFLQTLCLNDCCKNAGGRKMENGICVDVNGDRVSNVTSCTNSCKFWRW